jgi:hypothetical protein
VNRAHSILLAAALVSLSPSLAAATPLISVDLQSSYGTEGAPFAGVDPLAIATSPAFASAKVWNHLGSTGFNVQDPAFTELVDSTGTPTGAGFSITGKISAYGTGNVDAALVSDYFLWNTGIATSTFIDWRITGLTPSSRHVLFVNGVHDADFSMVVDEDANGDLGNDTAKVVSASGVLFHVLSDETGTITGRGTAISGEADWAGFQVATEPEPVYPLSADAKKCQDSVAKLGSKYFADRHKALADCRGSLMKGTALFEDKAKTLAVTSATECATEYKAAGKVAKARQKVRDGLEKSCTDAILGTLRACRSTIDGLADATGATGCLIESVDGKVGGLIASEYGY